jgi:hypothetical protein
MYIYIYIYIYIYTGGASIGSFSLSTSLSGSSSSLRTQSEDVNRKLGVEEALIALRASVMDQTSQKTNSNMKEGGELGASGSGPVMSDISKNDVLGQARGQHGRKSFVGMSQLLASLEALLAPQSASSTAIKNGETALRQVSFDTNRSLLTLLGLF